MSEEIRRQERENEEAKRRRTAEERHFVNALRTVAATPEGKTVLAWIIAQGDLFGSDFTPSSAIYYTAGMKAIPRRLWSVLQKYARREDFIEICIGEDNEG